MSLVPFRYKQHTELETDKVVLRVCGGLFVSRSIFLANQMKMSPEFAQLHINIVDRSVGIKYFPTFDPLLVGLVPCRKEGRGFRVPLSPLIKSLGLTLPSSRVKLNYIYKERMIVVDLSSLENM